MGRIQKKHVEDIINTFIMALDKSYSNFEIISLGSEIQNTLFDLFNYLANALHYEKSPIIMGVRAGDIKNIFMSGKKAKKLLNWVPNIKLSSGIKMLD